MDRFRKAIAAIAFAATAVVPAAAGTPATSAATGAECFLIVAFGSSSTEGVGASDKSHSYPARLAVDLTMALPDGRAVKVVNRGIGGEDAQAMMRRLDRDVIARRPNLVIWQTGSNDPMTRNPLPRFERETRDGIRAMQAAGIEVVLMEPQWAPHLDKIAGSTRYRDAVRRIGAEMGVTVIRRDELMHEWVKSGRMTLCQMLSADQLHMSDMGYEALAHATARAVLESATVTRRHPATATRMTVTVTRS